MRHAEVIKRGKTLYNPLFPALYASRRNVYYATRVSLPCLGCLIKEAGARAPDNAMQAGMDTITGGTPYPPPGVHIYITHCLQKKGITPRSSTCDTSADVVPYMVHSREGVHTGLCVVEWLSGVMIAGLRGLWLFGPFICVYGARLVRRVEEQGKKET